MSKSRARMGPAMDFEQSPMEQDEAVAGPGAAADAGVYGMAAKRQSMGLDSEGSGGGVPYGEELAWLFGLDLSDVSVQLGDGAALDSVDASATAEEKTLRFASTNPSKREVAHEVAHLAQFERGAPAQGAELSAPDEAPEREAEQAAHAAARGQRPQVSHRPSARRMRSAKRKTNAPDRLIKQKLNNPGEDGARAKRGGTVDSFPLRSDLGELVMYDSQGGEIKRINPADMLHRVAGIPSVQLNRHRIRSYPKNDGTEAEVTRVYAFSVGVNDPSAEDGKDAYSGWIDIESLQDSASVAQDVGANREGKKVTAVHKSEPFKITGAGSDTLTKYQNDRVTKNPNNGDENCKAIDYLGGEHDRVNLAIGLPGYGGGISTHTFTGDGETEFHQVNDLYYSAPLYKWVGTGEKLIHSRRLLFVYGWAKLGAEKVWGWIARAAIRPNP